MVTHQQQSSIPKRNPVAEYPKTALVLPSACLQRSMLAHWHFTFLQQIKPSCMYHRGVNILSRPMELANPQIPPMPMPNKARTPRNFANVSHHAVASCRAAMMTRLMIMGHLRP